MMWRCPLTLPRGERSSQVHARDCGGYIAGMYADVAAEAAPGRHTLGHPDQPLHAPTLDWIRHVSPFSAFSNVLHPACGST